MTQIHRFTLFASTLILGFALVGCDSSQTSAPSTDSNDIQQYLNDHPELKEQDELDAADDAELE